ncbi:MAG: hypothetical protein Q7R40_10895 [Phaeospirillum sp.]|nr:hypothetical protein [Phaeospirillum sp.]
MLASEKGKILTFMLRHRQARLGSGSRKALRGESGVARLLSNASKYHWDELVEIFESFGFSLEIAEGGLGRPEFGDRTFLLIRDPHLASPAFGGSSPVLDLMKRRKSELPRVTRIWWLFIWAHHMALLYEGRALSEISRFIGADFNVDHLSKSVIDGIEKLSRTEIDEERRQLFADVLLDGDPHTEVPVRVKSFLEGMVSAGLLEAIDGVQPIYRQTLLSAKEAERCVTTGFHELITLPIQNPSEAALQIGAPLDDTGDSIAANDE